MTTADFRCSAASLAATEPLEGTASTVRRFLLLETPGPWGVHAVREARLHEGVRDRLLEVERLGVRPLLVRRPGRRRDAGGPVRVLAAHTHGRTPWAESADLADPRELLDLPLESLAAGRSMGLASHAGPLFLVCTHGRHDACCAELGRPLAAALAEAAPAETWEVSHIGGDRFAPNVLVLPHGLYYGRLLPAEAEGFVETHRAGRLDLEHLRGRTAYPFAVQAAEVQLRRHLDLHAVGALPVVSRDAEGGLTAVVFLVDGKQWRVRVRTERSAPARLTCRASQDSTGLLHTLVDVAPAEAG